MDKQTILVTIQIEQRDDWCKLRRWLKVLLRGYGIKCVSVEPAKRDTHKDASK